VVVLVHGLGVSSRYMVPAIRALSPDFLVYAPDLPGYGRTPGPRHALSIRDLSDSLVEWMTAMDIEKPLFVGNSMGCQILVELAVRFPTRVERLVLIGPTMDRAARSGPKQVWRLVRDTFREAPSQPLVVAYDYLRFGPRRFRQTFYDALADRIERKLPRIQVPVLVMRGANDPIVPRAWAHELADLAPNGRYAEVGDTGHTVNYMSPRALARAVRHYIRDVPYTGDRYATPRRESSP
jgi:pimeloyl-ACP methyl ester carboxylesterase